jgi:glycosyltransferase involved in cell wall biosynthesis
VTVPNEAAVTGAGAAPGDAGLRRWSVSVVMPIYNEIESVERSVQTVDRFLSQHLADHEIVLVESGSTDGSREACDALAERLPSVVVLHEAQRNGFGHALRLGIHAATREAVWILPVDLPYGLDALLEALRQLDTVDCVLSYRINDPRDRRRRLQSWVYNLLVNWTLGLRVRSVNSALKVYRREVITGLTLHSRGWFIDAEVIYWLRQRGIAFAEIPIELVDRELGTSKVSSLDPLKMCRELLAFKLSTLERR